MLVCAHLMNPIDIAQKWSSMTAASAWEAWVEYTLACQENRAKVQGSLIRLLHRTLYAAFTAWQDAAADRAHQRAKIATCVARISNRVRPVSFDLAWLFSRPPGPPPFCHECASTHLATQALMDCCWLDVAWQLCVVETANCHLCAVLLSIRALSFAHCLPHLPMCITK